MAMFLLFTVHDNNDYSYIWGSSGTTVEHQDMYREEDGFYGYQDTNAVKAFAKSKNMTLKTGFPATYHATENHEISYAAPVTSSSWFLPSDGQYWILNKTELFASVNKATGNPNYTWVDDKGYWSGSEASEEVSRPDKAQGLSFKSDDVQTYQKGNFKKALSILSF